MKRFTWDWSEHYQRQVVTDHCNSNYEMMEKECCEMLNDLFNENQKLKLKLQR